MLHHNGTIAKFLFLQSAKFGNSRTSRFLSCVLSIILNLGSSSETLFLRQTGERLPKLAGLYKNDLFVVLDEGD